MRCSRRRRYDRLISKYRIYRCIYSIHHHTNTNLSNEVPVLITPVNHTKTEFTYNSFTTCMIHAHSCIWNNLKVTSMASDDVELVLMVEFGSRFSTWYSSALKWSQESERRLDWNFFSEENKTFNNFNSWSWSKTISMHSFGLVRGNQ